MAEEQKQEKPVAPVVKASVEMKAPAPVSKAPAPKAVAPAPKSTYKHIVRIAQVDIPGDKIVQIALKKIKGIGFNLAAVACNLVEIKQGTKAGDLTDEQIKRLNEVISNPKEAGVPVWMLNRRKDYETGEDKHLLIGTLDFVQNNTIKRLMKIKCYRGTRHSTKRPVRGQRTKSNFRRSKGKVVGVAKKKGIKSGK